MYGSFWCFTHAVAVIQESAAGLSAEVQAAYSALLEQVLSHLQLLGVESVSTNHSKKKAQERLYSLLEALAKVSTVHQGVATGTGCSEASSAGICVQHHRYQPICFVAVLMPSAASVQHHSEGAVHATLLTV